MAQKFSIVPIDDQSEEALLRAGWKKLTTLDEGRLTEMVETYRCLGYEVYVQEFVVGEGCTVCFGAGRELGKIQGTVWIRPGSGVRNDNELFD